MKNYNENAPLTAQQLANRDKKRVKKKGTKDLSEMYSVKVYTNTVTGKKYSHTMFATTKERLRENMNNKNSVTYGEIRNPNK